MPVTVSSAGFWESPTKNERPMEVNVAGMFPTKQCELGISQSKIRCVASLFVISVGGVAVWPLSQAEISRD